MFIDGLFEEKGVFPPELIGKHESCFNYIMKYLEERDIHYIKSQI
jgi:lysine 6-dehydrogenase